MFSANKTLMKFIKETRFETLPADVVHQAKRAMLDTYGCILGGTTYTEHNKKITGDWDKPMTDQELIDKFSAYTAPVLGRQHADDICNQIMALEQVADINDLLMPLSSIQID